MPLIGFSYQVPHRRSSGLKELYGIVMGAERRQLHAELGRRARN